MRLAASAPGKVNLCLLVGRHRSDGRHEVVTLLESVSLADGLTVSVGGTSDEVICPGVEGPNLVSRALEGLRERGWDGPPVRVEIAKRIPVAAGMGGGSADAAAMLRLAQRLHPVPEEVVSKLAAELGSDVPSQLEPGVAIGTGAGDIVRPVPPLQPHALVIVPSEHALSAGDVYAEADRLGVERGPDELAAMHEQLSAALEREGRPPDELLVNDLGAAAISLCPEITGALSSLREAGADHELVSGSGPTTFGLFWGPDCEQRARAAVASLDLPATSTVPWSSGSDIHALRHNLDSTDE